MGWGVFSPLRALRQEQSHVLGASGRGLILGGCLGLCMCPGRGYLWGPHCPPGTQRWRFVLNQCPVAVAGILWSAREEVTMEGPGAGKGQTRGRNAASAKL